MALTIVETPGAANANSYSTKAEASSIGGYFETRLFSTDWTDASTPDRNIALVWATRLLDDWVEWQGHKVSDGQALRWPRSSVSDRDGYAFDNDEIPQFLKNATAELAVYLLEEDPTAAPDTLGFSRLKVASLELVVDKSDRDKESVIPDSVKSMVELYGKIRQRGGSSSVDLMRG